jgi:hypothetical protein
MPVSAGHVMAVAQINERKLQRLRQFIHIRENEPEL